MRCSKATRPLLIVNNDLIAAIGAVIKRHAVLVIHANVSCRSSLPFVRNPREALLLLVVAMQMIV